MVVHDGVSKGAVAGIVIGVGESFKVVIRTPELAGLVSQHTELVVKRG